MGGKSNKRIEGYQMNEGDRFYDYPGQREEDKEHIMSYTKSLVDGNQVTKG